MSIDKTHSLISQKESAIEVKKYRTEQETIFYYLKNNVATATMVSRATGIPQKSICRYKRDLEERGLLYEVEKRLCQITKHSAWYLTTNPELNPNKDNFNTTL